MRGCTGARVFRLRPDDLDSGGSTLLCLPFLYSTRTIRRRYSVQAVGVAGPRDHGNSESSSHGLDRNAVELPDSDYMIRKVSVAGTRERVNGARVSHDNHSNSKRVDPLTLTDRLFRAERVAERDPYFLGGNDQPPRHESPEFVPFERSAEDALYPPASVPSTITSYERRAFDRLKALRPHNEVQRGGASTTVPEIARRKPPSSLDAILDQALLEASKPRSTRKEAEKGSEQTERRPRVKLPTVPCDAAMQRQTEFDRIRALLEACETDFDVWKVLQDSILGPITASGLDAEDGKTLSPREEKVMKADLDAKLNIIGQNFSHLMVQTALTMRQKFPSSPLNLAIIPQLRRTGPSAFALGISTRLYNECLSHAIVDNSDVVGVVDIISEMEREVMFPNKDTVGLLHRALDQANQAKQGLYGDAVRVMFGTDRMRKAIKDILAYVVPLRQTLRKAGKL